MFEIYKKGQGYWTRLLTMVGGGIIVLAGAYWLFDQPLKGHFASGTDMIVRSVGAAVFIVLGGFLTFHFSYGRRGTGDFFIATEGEMKKVSWSSRKEIIGSTQVVIFTLLAMGLLLFVVDILFEVFFHLLGVLKRDPIRTIFGTPEGQQAQSALGWLLRGGR